MSPKSNSRSRKTPGAMDAAIDSSDPSPLHAAIQELESLLSGVALPEGLEAIDPTTGRRRTTANADDERAGTELSERLLDVAAGLASLHPALHGKRLLLRSLLAWEAKSGAAIVAGEPLEVLGPEELGEGLARKHSEMIGSVWQEKMFDLGAAAVALGTRTTPRRTPEDLRHRSFLLGLRHGGSYLFPAFQFDLLEHSLHPEVGAVNQALGAKRDPWGVASWWISPNPRLAGDRPMDLVGSDRAQEIVTAARALAQPLG